MMHELSAEEQQKIATCLEPFQEDRRNLIPILQRIQESLAYLPPEAIQMVAKHLHLSAGEVYGVATFYNQFRFHPPGKHPIKVCLGTACHVRGGEIILENFERKLGIRDGQTTAGQRIQHRPGCLRGMLRLSPCGPCGGESSWSHGPEQSGGTDSRLPVWRKSGRKEKKQKMIQQNHEASFRAIRERSQ